MPPLVFGETAWGVQADHDGTPCISRPSNASCSIRHTLVVFLPILSTVTSGVQYIDYRHQVQRRCEPQLCLRPPAPPGLTETLFCRPPGYIITPTHESTSWLLSACFRIPVHLCQQLSQSHCISTPLATDTGLSRSISSSAPYGRLNCENVQCFDSCHPLIACSTESRISKVRCFPDT